MKFLILFLFLFLTGCSTMPERVANVPKLVETPVAKFCLEKEEIPQEPTWPLENLKVTDNISARIIAAAWDELELRKVYVAGLKKLLNRCIAR